MNKNLIRIFFIFSLVFILIFAIFMNVQAYKDDPYIGSCHTGEDDYTISANMTSLECDAGDTYKIKITSTGPGVVVDIFPEALDNEYFMISPGVIIEDGDPADNNPANDAISVTLEIKMPSSDGQYTLRILSRGPSTSGEFPLSFLDLKVSVGIIIKPLLLILLEDYNLFIGGFAVISIFLGTFVFKIHANKGEMSKVNKREIQKTYDREFPKSHIIFMFLSFILTTINFFLIINDTVYIIHLEIELTPTQSLGLFNHIILGTIGYLAGIIVIFGIYAKVPGYKLKFIVYILLIGWIFNFLNGISINIPTYNFESLF